MNRIYVRCLDGVTRVWKVTLLTKWFLKMRGGWFTVRGARYHIDPEKYERHAYRPIFPTLRLVEKYRWASYYHEGHEEPFKLSAPMDVKGNARNIQAVTEAAYARNLMPSPVPWVMVIIILGMFIGLGALGFLAGR